MKRLVLGVLLFLTAGCSHFSNVSSPESPPATTSTPAAETTTPAAVAPVRESPEVGRTPQPQVKEIADQSFDTTLDSWGKVRFVSAEQTNEDGRTELLLSLQDSHKNVLYTFPKPKLTEGWQLDSVKAVSFQDVNQDGRKDVLVLADYFTGAGEEGVVPFTAATTFLQGNQEFISDTESDDDLYSSGNVSTVKDVTAYYKAKSFRVRLCRQALAADMTEEDIVHAYYDESEKLGYDASEAGQDAMFAEIGSCFEQETDRLLARNGELDSKATEV
ncbi:FG-GAP repeat domain-containing protein [Cohnella caldifontis]|uniref:FG-GAP repeat domain-containing protein n=1 Tax=Cohnella caldifontis TaxID=3027471 RepID=UPI0023EBE821|nr:VCBS repeat-containing protein [Cohnella sp. YIM B05605]